MDWKKCLGCVFLMNLLLTISCATKIKESMPLSKVNEVKEINVMTENVKPQKETAGNAAEVVKAVIEMPELQNYFHIEQNADRKPLYILKSKEINTDLGLNKFGESVRLATCDELKKSNKPYLEFPKLDIKNNKAKVVFRYRVQGIEGKVSLSKADGGWKIDEQKISEVKFEDAGCSSS